MLDLSDEELQGVTDIKSSVLIINKKLEHIDTIHKAAKDYKKYEEDFKIYVQGIKDTLLEEINEEISKLNSEKSAIETVKSDAINSVNDVYNARKDLISAGMVGGTVALFVMIISFLLQHQA